jgi:ribosomal protein S18 acetylase RimI-like enzyme
VSLTPSTGGASAAAHGPHPIAVLRWEHEQQAAAVLARAFVDDPLVIAICNLPALERRKRMQWGFRVALRSHCLAAQPAWAIMDSAAAPGGVVLVTRARAPAQAVAQSDLLFTLRGFWHIGLRAGLRGFRAAQLIAVQAPPEPFTYLRTLAVDPELQGRGLGSRLVEQVLRAAPISLPVYLETATERNLAFYARHGFECRGEFSCLGVRVWRLVRPAAA